MSLKTEPEHLKVTVRVRPLLEIDGTTDSVVHIEENNSIKVIDGDHLLTSSYSKIFDETSTQSDVFSYVYPAIKESTKGFNCTLFAYGQTGTGKTHTMFGNRSVDLYSADSDEDLNLGLIPNSIKKLFEDTDPSSITFYCSFLQIYNENLYDLLQDPKRDKNLKIRENKMFGIFVQGLAEYVAENTEDCFLLLSKGEASRAVRQTRFNNFSSRSHSIFQVLIESNKANKKGVLKKAKVNFCDLAGSEKYDKEGKMVSGHIKELTQINKSLSTLGKVIFALGTGSKTHIPYRDSKLTRLLSDSLGVNTRTILIATVSPSPMCIDETINTLKFADRAKQVMVNIKKNTISATNDQLINKLQREIQHLKQLLNLKRKGGIYELEQKIWVLSEENQKLKSVKSDFTVAEVEKLKVENKRLRLELQKIGTQGVSNGFGLGSNEESPRSSQSRPGFFEDGAEKFGKISRSGLPTPEKEIVKNSLKCDICLKNFPCIHTKTIVKNGYSSMSPLENKRTLGPLLNSHKSDVFKNRTPDLTKRMNIRYKISGVAVEKRENDLETKQAEARKKEINSIKERLNKIAELEALRKEHFQNELKKLEDCKKEEQTRMRKKSSEALSRKKSLEKKYSYSKL